MAKKTAGAAPSAVITQECCAASPAAIALNDSRREGDIEQHRWLWRSGEPITYSFSFSDSEKGTEEEEAVVKGAIQTWLGAGMGLALKQSNDIYERAQIRIGFAKGGGSISRIGNEAADAYGLSLNFGSQLIGEKGRLLALHEVGHALGFRHEHQNPVDGIAWKDTEAARQYFMKQNRWSGAKAGNEVINPLPAGYFGNWPWDPDSIMNYNIPGTLLRNRTKDVAPKGLSKGDIARALRFYRPVKKGDVKPAKPFAPVMLPQESGEQGFFLISPKEDRKYVIRTFGELDVSMTLYEQGDDGVERYMATDDDGGTDDNAEIEMRLFANRRYVVRLRVLHAPAPIDASLIVIPA
jgi:hypothetical protein